MVWLILLTSPPKAYIIKIMNDTPITDAVEPKIQTIKGGWVRADFARSLERKVNQYHEILDKQARQIISLNSTIEQLRKELEELE